MGGCEIADCHFADDLEFLSGLRHTPFWMQLIATMYFLYSGIIFYFAAKQMVSSENRNCSQFACPCRGKVHNCFILLVRFVEISDTLSNAYKIIIVLFSNHFVIF